VNEDAMPAVLRRLVTAMNEHDLEAYLDCFDPEYVSEQPLHRENSFRGRERIRQKWAWKLRDGSDFRAEVPAFAVNGDTAWIEWRWSGTRRDGAAIDERGIAVYGLRAGRIVSGRLYVEPFTR
jgi:ketosteroid isomerase-like protein